MITKEQREVSVRIAELESQVDALKELLIECTDNGELDGRLLASYMEFYISKSTRVIK